MRQKNYLFLSCAFAITAVGFMCATTQYVMRSKGNPETVRDKETPAMSVTPIKAVDTMQVVSINDIDRLVITGITKGGVKVGTSASVTIGGKVYIVPVALHKLISKALGNPSYQVELRNDSVVALINTKIEYYD